jgi:hypothetical protein
MTEAELVTEIGKLCDQPWLIWHHCPDSRRCAGVAGMPDLFIAGRAGCLWVELKQPGRKLRPEQTVWRYMLTAAGQRYVIWTERDLDNGAVRSALEALL